jgi:hypothetical protein
MRTFTAATALALAITLHRPAAAQASPAGTWNTEFDIGIRNENGVETSMGKRAATMTLTLKGDSVFGSWQVAADSSGPAPAPIKLSGVRSGTKVTLRAEPVGRTVRMNDDEQRVTMVTSYSVELKGDLLEGTTRVAALDGSFESNDRPFSAKRAKN